MITTAFTQAIASLEQDEAKLLELIEQHQGMLAKVRAALTSLRPLAGVPEPSSDRRASRKPDRRAPVQTTAAKGKLPDEAAVLARLARGPMTPKAFQDAFGLSRYNVRAVLRPLIERKRVTIAGTTHARRIALAGSPAKEAP